jgi:uncharacterized peroxidase-related enzyme
MSLLQTISPAEATGDVATIYANLQKGFGSVPNAFQMASVSPAMLKQQFEFVSHYLAHPNLSGPLLACIRMLVSSQTACEYCIGMNAGMLINLMGWTPEQVSATQADPANANLPPRETAMLIFVLKTTREPLAVTAADVDALRGLGWNDADIFDAANHGARMVAMDILLNAFKVERDY